MNINGIEATPKFMLSLETNGEVVDHDLCLVNEQSFLIVLKVQTLMSGKRPWQWPRVSTC